MIEFKGFLIASIYFKFDNSLGLNFKLDKKNFVNIINLVLKFVKPLPRIDSDGIFIMNLASQDNEYKKFLKILVLKKYKKLIL